MDLRGLWLAVFLKMAYQQDTQAHRHNQLDFGFIGFCKHNPKWDGGVIINDCFIISKKFKNNRDDDENFHDLSFQLTCQSSTPWRYFVILWACKKARQGTSHTADQSSTITFHPPSYYKKMRARGAGTKKEQQQPAESSGAAASSLESFPLSLLCHHKRNLSTILQHFLLIKVLEFRREEGIVQVRNWGMVLSSILMRRWRIILTSFYWPLMVIL